MPVHFWQHEEDLLRSEQGTGRVIVSIDESGFDHRALPFYGFAGDAIESVVRESMCCDSVRVLHDILAADNSFSTKKHVSPQEWAQVIADMPNGEDQYAVASVFMQTATFDSKHDFVVTLSREVSKKTSINVRTLQLLTDYLVGSVERE
jgi:hypothetical protein